MMRVRAETDKLGTAEESNCLNTASAATNKPPKRSSSGIPIISPRATAAAFSELGLRISFHLMSSIRSGKAPASVEQPAAITPPP
jgi:hypothetical protein